MTIVRALDISVGTGSVFVWRSVFADLINPHEVSLRSERRLGLSVTGVLGVLLRAKRDGQLNLVKPEIEALRARANFFVDSALETTILATVGE